MLSTLKQRIHLGENDADMSGYRNNEVGTVMLLLSLAWTQLLAIEASTMHDVA